MIERFRTSYPRLYAVLMSDTTMGIGFITMVVTGWFVWF